MPYCTEIWHVILDIKFRTELKTDLRYFTAVSLSWTWSNIGKKNHLETKVISIIFKAPLLTSKKAQRVCVTRINWLILFKEISTVYCENHTKHTQILTAKCRVTSPSKSWKSSARPQSPSFKTIKDSYCLIYIFVNYYYSTFYSDEW